VGHNHQQVRDGSGDAKQIGHVSLAVEALSEWGTERVPATVGFGAVHCYPGQDAIMAASLVHRDAGRGAA
jgi:hypothetical protein